MIFVCDWFNVNKFPKQDDIMLVHKAPKQVSLCCGVTLYAYNRLEGDHVANLFYLKCSCFFGVCTYDGLHILYIFFWKNVFIAWTQTFYKIWPWSWLNPYVTCSLLLVFETWQSCVIPFYFNLQTNSWFWGNMKIHVFIYIYITVPSPTTFTDI